MAFRQLYEVYVRTKAGTGTHYGLQEELLHPCKQSKLVYHCPCTKFKAYTKIHDDDLMLGD
jgi:hypothetical protein